MVETLVEPILGIESDFPNSLFLLHHPASGRYGCYCHDGVHGLACFSTEPSAFRFAEHIELSGMSAVEVSFDQAREVAKARPLPVISLMLLDKINEPRIHYVR